MNVSVIEELRLTRFKSFRGATLSLRELTLLIGRNGAGKSNALDALEVLSRLAGGEDVRDALEGGAGTAGRFVEASRAVPREERRASPWVARSAPVRPAPH